MPTNCPHCRARIAPPPAKIGRGPGCPVCGTPFAGVAPTPWPSGKPDPDPLRTRVGLQSLDAVENLTVITVAAPSSFAVGPDVETPEPHARLAMPAPRSSAHRYAVRAAAGSVPEVEAGADAPHAPPSHVPGYRVESTLGFGGMGTVYLARQLSLDRPVALKVMSRRWSGDAVFAARFTREAFAAARMNHPNVVQIFDVGEAEGQRYFSMEYVPGRSLADHVKFDGKLDPETAVGYVLQAARGLKHAHDLGLIHRDVKPDNLLLNDQGVVKVADMGLVKTRHSTPEADALDPGAESPAGPTMTGARMALGTPAYMSPEQCRDAANVDHRADIYSLGCTLYVLVTGRTPFEGSTAVALMTKHAYEPIMPPELLVNRVPKELSAVILRMMAKCVDDRFATMAEVIRTLEQWLGIHHTRTFSPRDEQIDAVEKNAHTFNAAPTAVLRGRLVTGAVSTLLLGAVLLSFFGKLGWAFGVAGTVLQAAVAYFLIDGVANQTYLFRRARRFALGLAAWDWAIGVAAVGTFALLLGMLGLFWLWIGFSFLSTAAAFGLRLGLDRAVAAERADCLDATEKLLRRMRLGGLDEEELRLFVAKYAGRDWEEFFEALFGYEAKVALRGLLLRGGSAGLREKYAAWREPLINLMTRVERARKEARARLLLQEVARAAGIDPTSSDGPVDASADTVIAQAEGLRRANARHEAGNYPGVNTPMMLPNLGQILAAHQALNLADFAAMGAKRDWPDRVANLFVGPHVRVVAATVLMVACVLWVVQNRRVFPFDVPGQSAERPTEATAEQAGTLGAWTEPLRLDWLPEDATAWCDTANAGWAGVLLLASLFFRGNRMGAMVLVGAAICAFGHRYGIRTVEPIRDYHVALLLGSVFTLFGFRLARR